MEKSAQYRQRPDAAAADIAVGNRALSHPVAGLLIMVAGVLPYMSILRNGYYLDDDMYLLAAAKELSFRKLLTLNLFDFIRPVGLMFWKLQYIAFGFNPIPQLAVSVLLNVLNAFLLYLLASRLSGRAATGLIAGILFAAFPLNSGAVCWLAAQHDLLCGFFTLCAFYSFSVYRENGKRGPLLLTAVCVSLSMFSKEAGAVLPFGLLAMDMVFYRVPGMLRRMKAHLMFFALLAAYFIYRYAALGSIGGYMATHKSVTQTVFSNPLGYLKQVFFFAPLNLLGPLSYFENGWQVVVAFVVSSAIVASLVFGQGRLKSAGYKIPAFSALLIFIFLQPVSVIIISRGYLENPRYLYLPAAGFCIFLGWLLSGLTAGPRARVVMISVSLAAAAAYGALTWTNNQAWVEAYKESKSFYAEVGRVAGKADRDVIIYIYKPPVAGPNAQFEGIGPNGFGRMISSPDKIISVMCIEDRFWEGVSIMKKNPSGFKFRQDIPLSAEWRRPRETPNFLPAYFAPIRNYIFQNHCLPPEAGGAAVCFLWYNYAAGRLEIAASNIK